MIYLFAFLFSFKGNATRVSRLLRDNPRTFVQQAADWIEYVHRHKGAKHLRAEVHDLYWYQYYLVDVLAFLLIAILAFFCVIKTLFRLLWKIVTRPVKGNKTSKQEWELICFKDKIVIWVKGELKWGKKGRYVFVQGTWNSYGNRISADMILILSFLYFTIKDIFGCHFLEAWCPNGQYARLRIKPSGLEP